MEQEPTNENMTEEQLAAAQAAAAEAAAAQAAAAEAAAAQVATEAAAAQVAAEAAAAQVAAEAAAAEAAAAQVAAEAAATEAAEKAAAEKAAAEAAEKAAAEKAAAEAAEKAAAEAAEKAAVEKAAAEAAEKAAAEAAEKAAAEKAAVEKAAAEAKAAEEAAEKAAAEAAEKAAAEKAAEKAAAEAAEKAAAEKAAQEAQVAAEEAQRIAAFEQAAKEAAEKEALEQAVKQAAYEQEQAEIAAQLAALGPIPKLVFIVPFRNRREQKQVFDNVMPTILEDIPSTDYKIYFVQQCDTRDFNRGAMKNIGFLAMKEKYPNHYQDFTFVFNDVDTMPRKKNLLNYNTEVGTIKHFYGQENTLGGIVSIKGSDFEKTLGYPNFWAWGYEDNMLQIRALKYGLTIDRSTFFKIGDPNILQLNENLNRIINRDEFNRYVNYTSEGFSTINGLVYDVDDSNRFINVTQFKTEVDNNPAGNQLYDLRKGNRPFNVNPVQARGRRGSLMSLRL